LRALWPAPPCQRRLGLKAQAHSLNRLKPISLSTHFVYALHRIVDAREARKSIRDALV